MACRPIIVAALLLTASTLCLPPSARGGEQGSNAATKPKDNLDFWLSQGQTVQSQPATAPSEETRTASDKPARDDAVPGVIELSNGKQLPGYLFTTRGKNFELYVEEDKNFHRIPLISVLSITAKIDEEKLELEWRWKEMGTPEKVYTGRSYPTRILSWTFKLIDGTSVTGTIKGQPLYVQYGPKKSPPLVLHERDKGEMGQKLNDLVYIKRVIVSRKMMDAVLKDQAAQE